MDALVTSARPHAVAPQKAWLTCDTQFENLARPTILTCRISDDTFPIRTTHF
jgi:hypothetical protein